MKNNKKGMSDIMLNVLGLAFIAAISIFAFLFVKTIYSDELIPPITEQAINVLADNGNDTELYNLISSQQTNYQQMDYGIDLLFLAMWISSTIIGCIASHYAPKANRLQLFLFLFIGILVLLIGYNYIYQILDWIVTSFINDIFSSSDTYLPIFNYYVDNYIIINLFTVILFLMFNQFKRTPETEIIEEAQFYDNSFSGSTMEEEQ